MRVGVRGGWCRGVLLRLDICTCLRSEEQGNCVMIYDIHVDWWKKDAHCMMLMEGICPSISDGAWFALSTVVFVGISNTLSADHRHLKACAGL